MVWAAGDFDYVATRNQIIEGAMRIVGALDPDQTLTPALLSQGVKALQLLVKSWQNEHLFLWNFDIGSFVTVAAQEWYQNLAGLSSNALSQAIGLDKAWLVDSSGNDLELEVLSYSRYLDIRTKTTSTGRPTHIAFKPTFDADVSANVSEKHASFFLWPSPDAVYTIKPLVVFPLKDVDAAGGAGEIPVRFQRALKYGLAEDLFDEYPAESLNKMQYVQDKAANLFLTAKRSDQPQETTNEVEGLF